jgi:hypothetical protein
MMTDKIGDPCVMVRPTIPNRNRPVLHTINMRLNGIRIGNVSDGHGTLVPRGRIVRPLLHRLGQLLSDTGCHRRGQLQVQDAVQPTQVDIHRLVRMRPAGVLNGVRVDSQLVGVSEGYDITVLDA